MPNMANIVVKKADGTTNFTFTQLSSAPGDGGFAQWRGEGVSPALSANLRMKTQWNGARTARRFEVNGNFPKIQTVAGIATVTSFAPFSYTGAVPADFTAAEAADFAAVTANAIAAQLVRESVASGYAPT